MLFAQCQCGVQRLACFGARALLHVVATQVEESLPASHRIGGGFGVDLCGGIGPGCQAIAQRQIAFGCQTGQQQYQYTAHGVDGAWRKPGQHDSDEARHRHGPQVAAVQHQRVLHPDRGKFSEKQQQRKQQAQCGKAQRTAPTPEEPHRSGQQRHIACAAHDVRKRCERQRKDRSQIYGHPAHVREEP